MVRPVGMAFALLATAALAQDPSGAVLHGRVVDAAGRAIAGATVRALERSGSRMERARTTADAGGVFHLSGVELGVTIEASADGHASREIAFAGASTPSVLELEPTGFVAGRVVDGGGKPIAAEVVIEYLATPVRTLVTVGADGSFRATLRAAGGYRLRASAPKLASVQTEVHERPREDFELVLAPARSKTVVVRALDAASGAPVRDFRVALAWSALRGDAHAWRVATWAFARGDDVPGSDGRGELSVFAPLPALPSRPVLAVLAPGYAFTVVDDPDSLDVALVRESVIEGVVRDARTLAPLAGVEVWSVPCVLVELYPDASDSEARPWRAVRTDEHGRFRLTNLAVDEHIVHTRAPGRPVYHELVTLGDGETKTGLTLSVDSGCRWSVALTGRELPPGAALRLSTWRRDTPLPWHIQSRLDLVQSLDGGRASFSGLPTVVDDVWLRWPAPAQQGEPVETWLARLGLRTDRETRSELDVRGKEPAAVRGRIAVRGSLAPERLLVFSNGAYEQVAWDTNQRIGWRAPVGPDGRFELLLPPGPHRLRVLDAASGLIVHLDREIEVTPGPVQRDLEIAPASLRVRAPGASVLFVALPARIVDGDPRELDGTGIPAQVRWQGDEAELFVLPARIEIRRGDGDVPPATLDLQAGERRELELPAKER